MKDSSPLILKASRMSRGIIVTLLACIAQRFASSKRPTRYASTVDCSASRASLANRSSPTTSRTISRTTRPKGNFGMRRFVSRWSRFISLITREPGRCLRRDGAEAERDLGTARIAIGSLYPFRFPAPLRRSPPLCRSDKNNPLPDIFQLMEGEGNKKGVK